MTDDGIAALKSRIAEIDAELDARLRAEQLANAKAVPECSHAMANTCVACGSDGGCAPDHVAAEATRSRDGRFRAAVAAPVSADPLPGTDEPSYPMLVDLRMMRGLARAAEILEQEWGGVLHDDAAADALAHARATGLAGPPGAASTDQMTILRGPASEAHLAFARAARALRDHAAAGQQIQQAYRDALERLSAVVAP